MPLMARYTIHTHDNPITDTQNVEAPSATPAKALAFSPVKNKKINGTKAITFQIKYHQKVRICQVKWLSKMEPRTEPRFT